MAMQGSLKDMAVADLIQHNCQDHKTAQLIITHSNRQAALFFDAGLVQHASLDNITGEEVVYEVLSWSDGEFTLEMDVPPPDVTITRSWSGLLLTGAQRLDELQNEEDELTHKPNQVDYLNQEMNHMAKKRGEVLADTLTELLQESSDIHGVAIVGVDGEDACEK